MANIRFYSDRPSEGCNALCKTIGALRIKRRFSKFKPLSKYLIVNWGCSKQLPIFRGRAKVLNIPESVEQAVNKLETLIILQNYIPEAIPEFSTNKTDTVHWLEQGSNVYCRTKLQSSGGGGIVIATTQEETVDAPLYTKAFVATEEYRVHVFDGRCIDITKKAKRRGESPNTLIKNHSNGWVFIRGYESIIPSWVLDYCVDAVEVLCLDFGAVDVGYNSNTERCCIYEVNTAPGMSYNSITCKAYAKAIQEVCI